MCLFKYPCRYESYFPFITSFFQNLRLITVLKKQAKKAKKKMKKKASQMKLTSFWGKPKPKPKPSSN